MGGLPVCQMTTSSACVWLSEALCVIPFPPAVLPTDNTFRPPPLCPVSSHFSPLWSPLSSLSSSSSCAFFPPAPISRPRSVHARVKPVTMGSGIWQNSLCVVGVEGLAPMYLSSSLLCFTRTILQCPSLPLGAAIAGVWMAIWRECESTYPLNIYSGIQTKKVNRLHFSLFSSLLHNFFTFSMDVIFISHNSGCAIYQLPNTLPESVKRFCVYSICSAQYCSTFPSVLEIKKRGRKGKRKQSNCIWEIRFLPFVRTTFLNMRPMPLDIPLSKRWSLFISTGKSHKGIWSTCFASSDGPLTPHELLMHCRFNRPAPVLPVIMPFKCWSRMPLPQQNGQSRESLRTEWAA